MLLLNLPPSYKKKLRHRETKLVFTQLLSSNVCVKVTQSCPTLCNPMDYSLPGSSVYGILRARILEWVAIPFSRGYSQPRDQTRVFCIASRFFTTEHPWASQVGFTYFKKIGKTNFPLKTLLPLKLNIHCDK